MASDIIQRLRDRAKFNTAVSPYNLLLDAAEELEAADKAEAMMRDEIAALRKRCAELEAAPSSKMVGSNDHASTPMLGQKYFDENGQVTVVGYPHSAQVEIERLNDELTCMSEALEASRRAPAETTFSSVVETVNDIVTLVGSAAEAKDVDITIMISRLALAEFERGKASK
ncbi:hypothetical protein ACVITL_002877 [Rhizobium pisi]